MSRKALTPIIAVVLLLMMTVSTAGVGYLFITRSQGDIQATTQESVSRFQSVASCLYLADVVRSVAYVKNCGTTAISKNSFSVFVDGIKTDHKMFVEGIEPQGTAPIYFDGHYVGSHQVVIRSGAVRTTRLWDGGSAIIFDGIDDFVTVPVHESLNRPSVTDRITVSFWMKGHANIRSREKHTYPVVMSDGSMGSTWDRYAIRVETEPDTIEFNVGTQDVTPGITPKVPFTPDVWQHVVGTYDGTTLRLYINGIQVSKMSSLHGIGTIESELVFNGNRRGYAGHLDEVRIYDRALTENEIVKEMHGDYGTDGLVAYWSFEKDSQCTVVDERNGNVGRMMPACPSDAPRHTT